jgi:hypothetical protein
MADHEAGQGAAESILLALSETRLGDAVDALAAAVAEARFSVALSGRSLVPPQPHDALVMILPRAHAPLGLRRLPMSGDFQCQATSDGGVQAQDSTAQLEFLGLLRLKIEASICSELRGSVKSRQIGPAVKLLGLLRQLGPDQSPPPGDIVAVRTLPSPSCPFHDAAGVTPLCVHAHDVP